MLSAIDWTIIIAFFVVSLVLGLVVTKRAGQSTSAFFLSNRNMPWWLLGTSMVATTFSTDTPNLVADIVRTHGVSGNWIWWPFLLTGMLTTFVYAKLWRRSGVMTDIEFYELRYSGKAAAILRGFRALYLGVFFNVIIMASVSMAAIKIGGVLLGLTPLQTILIAVIITVIYSTLGGLEGVLITDFLQFALAIFGSLAAAIVVVNLPQVGGLSNMLVHERVVGKLSMLPDFTNSTEWITIFLIPLTVQWWSVWYPGAEPGGGGYIAQRMLAAKNENEARAATLLFNVAHYALRPWPWFVVALCSLVVFPDIASLRAAFPHVDPKIVKDDLAYPAMLTFLPHGLLGLLVASLLAAYMSTISTHLNWGSSYVVNDFYRRFIKPNAGEKELVRTARITMALSMALAGGLALWLSHSLQVFNIILQIGAGTGLLFILRWFWWRINAASEIAAMVISGAVAVYFQFVHTSLGLPKLLQWQELTLGVAITTVGWIVVTLVTKSTDPKTLLSFYTKVQPGGPGWKKVVEMANEPIGNADGGWDVPIGILCTLLGSVAVFGAVFATGYWIYGRYVLATALTLVAAVATWGLVKTWSRLDNGAARRSGERKKHAQN